MIPDKKYVLKFPGPYSFYDNYFQKHQQAMFFLYNRIDHALENRTNWPGWEQDFHKLLYEKDLITRTVMGELALALFEDEADCETEQMVYSIAKLSFSYEAYSQLIKTLIELPIKLTHGLVPKKELSLPVFYFSSDFIRHYFLVIKNQTFPITS